MSGHACRGERGSVAVAGLLLLFSLALLLGFAVDIARAFILRAELSSAADAAALAGAGEIDLAAWAQGRLALDPGLAASAANATLAAEGELGGVVDADSAGVTVALTARLPTFGLHLVGLPEFRVRAVARAAPETP